MDKQNGNHISDQEFSAVKTLREIFKITSESFDVPERDREAAYGNDLATIHEKAGAELRKQMNWDDGTLSGSDVRSALVKILNIAVQMVDDWDDEGDRSWNIGRIRDWIPEAREALKGAPAEVSESGQRNCDRTLAQNLLSAVCLYCTEKNIQTPFIEWGTIQHTAFLRWLFAKDDENGQQD